MLVYHNEQAKISLFCTGDLIGWFENVGIYCFSTVRPLLGFHYMGGPSFSKHSVIFLVFMSLTVIIFRIKWWKLLPPGKWPRSMKQGGGGCPHRELKLTSEHLSIPDEKYNRSLFWVFIIHGCELKATTSEDARTKACPARSTDNCHWSTCERSNHALSFWNPSYLL